MSVSRVASLTERALINPTVLDWINPPNCENLKSSKRLINFKDTT